MIEDSTKRISNSDSSTSSFEELEQRRLKAIAFNFWRASNVPERHRDVKPEQFTHDGWNTGFSRVQKLLGTGSIILLSGKRGCGKTQMAVHAIRVSAKDGRDGYYTKALDIFIGMRSCYRQGASMSEESLIKQYVRYKLLVIDALEEKSDSEWENRMLSHVIDKRYDAKVDTILITNETPEDFTRQHGSSISDRLRETGGIISFNWESFRSFKSR